MAMNARLSVIILGILILTLFISESECKPLQDEDSDTSFTNLNDKDPQPSYTQYLREALMDASHVIDNMINKGKMKLMELPYEGWVM